MEATAPATQKFYVGQSHTYSQVIDDKLVRAFADLERRPQPHSCR